MTDAENDNLAICYRQLQRECDSLNSCLPHAHPEPNSRPYTVGRLAQFSVTSSTPGNVFHRYFSRYVGFITVTVTRHSTKYITEIH